MEFSEHEKWMELALQEARLADAKFEVPVGAVIVRNGEVVARNHNRRETTNSSIAHAEMLVVEEANRKLGAWRLSDCTLYVTLEPCIMCSGAIINSRIKTLVYGTQDPKAGAVNSLYALLMDKRLNHRPEVISNVLKDECSTILTEFFSRLRENRTTV